MSNMVREVKIKVETDIGDHNRQMRNLKNNTKDATRAASRGMRNYAGATRKAVSATRLIDRHLAMVITGLQGAAMAGGGAGVAIAGVGFAAVGAVAGMVALGKAIVGVADDARELVEVAKEHPQFIDESQVQRLIETDDALGAVRKSTLGAGVALATVLAPEIETVAITLVAGTMAVKEYAEEIVAFSKVAMMVTAEMTRMAVAMSFPEASKAVRGMRAIISGTENAARGIQHLGEVTGLTEGATDSGSSSFEDYVKQARDIVLAFDDVGESSGIASEEMKNMKQETDGAGVAMKNLNDQMKVFEDLWATGEELAAITADAASDTITAQEAINLKYAERINLVRGLQGNEEATADAIAALTARRDRDLSAQIQKEADERTALHEQRLEQIGIEIEEQRRQFEEYRAGKLHEAELEKEAMQDKVDAVFSFSEASIDSFQQTLSNIDELNLAMTSKQAKRMQTMQKGLAIASAVMSGAQAAVAGFAPPPVGFGPIGGFAFLPIIAAQVATQVAVISSASSTKHSGGPIDRSGMAPDEVSITGKDGEFMVNGMGRAAAGDASLEALNRGERSRGAGPTVALQLDHRYFSEFVARDRRLVGSELGKALNTNRNIGYRS